MLRLSNPDLRRLVIGETISTYGSLMSLLALPFVALLYLHRGAGALAVVGVAEMLPGFVAGLFAGVWVDRLSRRDVLVATNAIRFGLVGLVPVLAWMGALNMVWLVVIAAATGLIGSLYLPAYRAILPVLVSTQELTEANSLIEGSNAVAEICAFASAGFLVQVFTAPTAMLIDAITFGVAAIFAAGLPATPPSIAHKDRRTVMVEMGEGLRVVRRQTVLRPMALGAVALGLGRGLMNTLFVLHVTRTLGYRPGPQGLVYAVGGVVSIIAATIASRVTNRLGAGRAVLVGLTIESVAMLFVVFAPSPSWAGYSMLTAQQVIGDLAMTVAIVANVAIRQTHTPDGMRGRVESAIGTATTFGVVIGMATAGWLGPAERLGTRGGLGLGAALYGLAVLVMLPLRSIRT